MVNTLVIKVVKHFHHQERQFEEAAASHRWEAQRLLHTDTAGDDFLNERPVFVEMKTTLQQSSTKRNEFTFMNFQSRSAEAFGAQREVLTHEAAEEMHQRDGISLE